MNQKNSNERKVITTKSFLAWVDKKIKQTVNLNPKLLELSELSTKQENKLKFLIKNHELTNEKLENLEISITELTREIKQFNQSINSVREHISSLDEKIESTEKLRTMIYAIWDVQIQKTEPKIKEAEMLVRSYRHLLNTGPEKRSKVNNDDITELFRKRWTDTEI